MKRTLLYLVSFLLAAALGFGAVYLFAGRDGDDEPQEYQRPSTLVSEKPEYDGQEKEHAFRGQQESPAVEKYSRDEEEKMTATDVVKEERTQVPSEYKEPVLEVVISGRKLAAVDDGMFSLSGLSARNGSGDYEYQLYDKENHSYKSTDGNFPNVASNSGGAYYIKVKDLGTGKTSSAKAVYGFKYVKPVEKLEGSRIQQLFNTGSSSSFSSVRDNMVQNVKIVSNVSGVSTISAVCQKVNMEDMRAVVTGVKYDGSGRVTQINVELHESE